MGRDMRINLIFKVCDFLVNEFYQCIVIGIAQALQPPTASHPQDYFNSHAMGRIAPDFSSWTSANYRSLNIAGFNVSLKFYLFLVIFIIFNPKSDFFFREFGQNYIK